jgi:hypothetical protein
MTGNYQQAIANLEAALGWETINAKGKDDFQIKDIWGIFPFLETSQSYYFVGSRGSGKSILVAQSIRLLRSNDQTMLCALDGTSFKSIGECAENETVKKFIIAFFTNLLGQIKERKNYKQVAHISSIYAKYREWVDFRESLNYLNNLTGQETKNLTDTGINFAKNHLRLLMNIASIKISLLDVGILQFGSIKLTPFQLEFKANDDAHEIFQANEIRDGLNNDIGFIEPVLSPLVDILAKHCKEQNIDRIILLGDDFHFLSLVSQVRIIHFLRRVIGQLRPHGISMVLKIFSATNISPYIKGVLGLAKKELEVRNIESSLENLEIKRQAIENLLVIILKNAKWSDENIRRLFRREIIDHLLILSGGHPRRFLEMSAKLIEITKGNLSNLYQDTLLSAAKILSDYRKDISIQLGIDGDPRANQYQKVYENAISILIEGFKDGDSPFFLISHEAIETHINFSQWVDDAITIGDLLEISNLIRVNQIPYKLVCINPASAYYKQRNFHISYQDIVDIQNNARSFLNESPIIGTSV